MVNTTVSRVENELNNSCTFTSDTIPDKSAVEMWINEETSEVHSLTSNKWKEETVTDVFDYTGQHKLFTKYAPIKDETLYLNENGVGKSPSWTSLNKWEKYEVNEELGKIILVLQNLNIKEQRHKLKADYTKGFNVPDWVEGVVARRVALRIIEASLNEDLDEGIERIQMGDVTVYKPSDFGASLYEQLKQRVKEDTERLQEVNGVMRYART